MSEHSADTERGFTPQGPTVLERGMRNNYFPHPAYELANIFEQHTPTLTRDDRYYAATQMELDDWRLLARRFGLTLRREGDVRYALVILANRTDEWEFWETVRREGRRLGLHNDGSGCA